MVPELVYTGLWELRSVIEANAQEDLVPARALRGAHQAVQPSVPVEHRVVWRASLE